MAGRDMSANLGGMLTGTANALGTAGSAYAPSLVRNIENMSRPDADPTDIASQQSLMQWQTHMGRVDEAALTGANIKQQQAQAALDAESNKEQMKVEAQGKIAQIEEQIAKTIASDMPQQQKDAVVSSLQSAVTNLAVGAGLDATEYGDIGGKALSKMTDVMQKQATLAATEMASEREKAQKAAQAAAASHDLLTKAGQEKFLESPEAQAAPEYAREAIKTAQLIDKNNQANLKSIAEGTGDINTDVLVLLKNDLPEGDPMRVAAEATLERIDTYNKKDPSTRKVYGEQSRNTVLTAYNQMVNVLKPVFTASNAKSDAEVREYRTLVQQAHSPSKMQLSLAQQELIERAKAEPRAWYEATPEPTPEEITQYAIDSAIERANETYNYPHGYRPGDDKGTPKAKTKGKTEGKKEPELSPEQLKNAERMVELSNMPGNKPVTLEEAKRRLLSRK